MSFELWLEFEQVDNHNWNVKEEFCNVQLTLPDGARYGLSVWTFAYLSIAIENDRQSGAHLHGLYIPPPDLLVSELSRDCIEQSISDLLQQGPLEEMLNPSVRVD